MKPLATDLRGFPRISIFFIGEIHQICGYFF